MGQVVNTDHIDIRELRQCMRLALDIVMAHRIAKGLSLDRAKVTDIRDKMESTVLLALDQVDQDAMPESWSWQAAAEPLAIQVALEIVRDQKQEPPETSI